MMMDSENFNFLAIIYLDYDCQNVSSCGLKIGRLSLCFSLLALETTCITWLLYACEIAVHVWNILRR